jgi:hypothetical protein
MDNKSDINKIKALVLLRLRNKHAKQEKARKRRWDVRPVLRERNVRGEYVTTFLKYGRLTYIHMYNLNN